MKPTIFTFHERIDTWNHSLLVRHWKEHWQRKQFAPIVLGRDVARRHPKFGAFVLKVREFPTINDRRYEEACYIRWLAFAVMLDICPDKRGIMADYDVFNQSFTPGMMGWNSQEIICHERTRVPCMVEATKAGAEKIIDFIMSRDPAGAGHYSDMYAFKESEWPISNFCLEMGDGDWTNAPCVHVASGAIHRAQPGADKTQFIRARFK